MNKLKIILFCMSFILKIYATEEIDNFRTGQGIEKHELREVLEDFLPRDLIKLICSYNDKFEKVSESGFLTQDDRYVFKDDLFISPNGNFLLYRAENFINDFEIYELLSGAKTPISVNLSKKDRGYKVKGISNDGKKIIGRCKFYFNNFNFIEEKTDEVSRDIIKENYKQEGGANDLFFYTNDGLEFCSEGTKSDIVEKVKPLDSYLRNKDFVIFNQKRSGFGGFEKIYFYDLRDSKFLQENIDTQFINKDFMKKKLMGFGININPNLIFEQNSISNNNAFLSCTSTFSSIVVIFNLLDKTYFDIDINDISPEENVENESTRLFKSFFRNNVLYIIITKIYKKQREGISGKDKFYVYQYTPSIFWETSEDKPAVKKELEKYLIPEKDVMPHISNLICEYFGPLWVYKNNPDILKNS